MGLDVNICKWLIQYICTFININNKAIYFITVQNCHHLVDG